MASSADAFPNEKPGGSSAATKTWAAQLNGQLSWTGGEKQAVWSKRLKLQASLRAYRPPVLQENSVCV